MFAGKKSAQIREILISESAWEEMTCLFAPSLAQYTPCSDMDEEQLITAIAITHVELILIHPFREGNGRLSRLLADVMAVQGGYKPLDYQSWEQNKTQYISAIHAGVSMDYEPMKHWVREALRRD